MAVPVLIETMAPLLEQAGVPADEAVAALVPLLRSVLAEVEEHRTGPRAFRGHGAASIPKPRAFISGRWRGRSADSTSGWGHRRARRAGAALEVGERLPASRISNTVIEGVGSQ
jgi:hypothetical protein